jgi:hypothetical protein
MKTESPKPRTYVEITAYWGNDDAESTIKVSRRCWQRIQQGADYERSAWSWYEGRRYPVGWRFSGRTVSVFGTGGDAFDGMECVLDLPIEELIVRVTQSE